MITVAIIGGSSGDALIQSCKKAGHKSIAICGKETDRGYGMADENHAIDLSNWEEIVEIILRKADCAVFGTGHKLAHNIALELFKKDFVISIDPYNAEYGKNKIKAYDFIQRLGYNTPKHRVFSNKEEAKQLEGEIPLPCVVKSSNDSVKTAKANNEKELWKLLDENFRSNEKVIVEEFIEGVEYTIPVVSDGINYKVFPEALKMTNINKIAVAHLRNFSDMDAKYDRVQLLDDTLSQKVVDITLDITQKMGLIGVPRFDLMVDLKGNVIILEVNEVAVSRIGPDHYPWEEVGINMADLMVENTINILRRKQRE